MPGGNSLDVFYLAVSAKPKHVDVFMYTCKAPIRAYNTMAFSLVQILISEAASAWR